MDLLYIMGWVLFCDVIMVYATYRLAYREADRARKMVEDRYQQALSEVSKVTSAIAALKIPTAEEIVTKIPPITIPKYPEIPHIPTVKEIIEALPPIRIPDEEMARIRESISGAINGTVGSYVKKAEIAVADQGDVDVGDVLIRSFLGKLMPK